MTTRLPAPARAVASAVSAAVTLVGERDAAGFDEAAAVLAGTDQAGLVQGAIVRHLLEELHPDGLDGDDVQAVLERCTRTSLEWLDVDPHVLLVLVASALGVYDPDADEAPPSPAAMARHAPLLLADLLAARRAGIDRYLTIAFAEIARAETMESP